MHLNNLLSVLRHHCEKVVMFWLLSISHNKEPPNHRKSQCIFKGHTLVQ